MHPRRYWLDKRRCTRRSRGGTRIPLSRPITNQTFLQLPPFLRGRTAGHEATTTSRLAAELVEQQVAVAERNGRGFVWLHGWRRWF